MSIVGPNKTDMGHTHCCFHHILKWMFMQSSKIIVNFVIMWARSNPATNPKAFDIP